MYADGVRRKSFGRRTHLFQLCFEIRKETTITSAERTSCRLPYGIRPIASDDVRVVTRQCMRAESTEHRIRVVSCGGHTKARGFIARVLWGEAFDGFFYDSEINMVDNKTQLPSRFSVRLIKT